MNNFIFAFTVALLAGCSASAWSTPRSEILTLSTRGSCATSTGQDVDLQRVMFLENRSLDIRTGSTLRRVSVDRETLYIETVSSTPPVTRYHEIDTQISESAPPDIELTLVVLGETIGVFWRETYQHQQYHQGIFQIEQDRISQLCSGIGGQTTER
jgi:hypothetical protein